MSPEFRLWISINRPSLSNTKHDSSADLSYNGNTPKTTS